MNNKELAAKLREALFWRDEYDLKTGDLIKEDAFPNCVSDEKSVLEVIEELEK